MPGLEPEQWPGRLGDSVSCSSASNCVAAGNYTDRDNGDQGFVVVDRNGRWGKAIRVPGLTALTHGALTAVNSVSCAPAGNCAAGGVYASITGGSQGFAVVERNGRWGKAIEVPGLGALNADGFAEVNSVSCAPVGRCTAVGDYTAGGDDLGFVTRFR